MLTKNTHMNLQPERIMISFLNTGKYLFMMVLGTILIVFWTPPSIIIFVEGLSLQYTSTPTTTPIKTTITTTPYKNRVTSQGNNYYNNNRLFTFVLSSSNKGTSQGGGGGGGGDDYDDWFAEFNPKEFEQQQQRVPSTRYSPATSNSRSEGGQSYNNNNRRPSRDNNDGPGQNRYRSSTNYNSRERSGGGRGGGGSIQYERDTTRDNSNVDVIAITQLLQDRVNARQKGDYDAADSIRETLLREHGVQVWDKDRIWRSGCSTSGSGGCSPPPPGRTQSSYFGDTNDRFGGRNSGRQQQQQQRRPKQDFGPLGHDYEPAPDSGPITSSISEDEIHEMIAERLQSKLARRFDSADRIQQELASAGVYVHDGRKEWRADGELFGSDDTSSRSNNNNFNTNTGRPGRERGSRNDRTITYTQSIHSEEDTGSLSDDDKRNIQEMIVRRMKAKLSRDYNTADEIREQLKVQYNVFLEDRLQEWSVNGNFGPDAPSIVNEQFRPWSQSTFSEVIQQGVVDDDENDENYDENNETTLLDEATILNLLDERSTAKANRDFKRADDIRDTLINEYNVYINDRMREWSIGGNFGLPKRGGDTSNDRSAGGRGELSFARRGSIGTLSSNDIETIETLIEQRSLAKKNRDFDTADTIRDQLDQEYNVKVDDKQREWRVVTSEYTVSSKSQNVDLDEKVLGYIQDRLRVRYSFKENRDWDNADAIRDELREQYSVSIDDRNNEFSILIDEFTVVDDDTIRTTTPRVATAPTRSTTTSDDSGRLFRKNTSTYTKSNPPEDYTILSTDTDDENISPFVSNDDDDDGGLTMESNSNDNYNNDENENESNNLNNNKNYNDNNTAERYTVLQLKEMLREAGMTVSGNKAELIERLRSAKLL